MLKLYDKWNEVEEDEDDDGVIYRFWDDYVIVVLFWDDYVIVWFCWSFGFCKEGVCMFYELDFV